MFRRWFGKKNSPSASTDVATAGASGAVEGDASALKAYWHEMAQHWWTTTEASEVVCCKCARVSIVRGDGFFSEIFGEIFCEGCCERRLEPDRLETIRGDKASVTQNELSAARRLAGRPEDDNRLSSFIEKLVACPDVAASEVGRFAVHLDSHRTATSYWDFLALAGTAIGRPDFFAGQPLTRCPPGQAVEFKEEDFHRGEHLLRSRASTIRRSMLDSGFSSSGLSPGEDPEGFCRAVVRVVEIPHEVSDDYRLAVGLVLLIVLSDFIGELTNAFWQTPDSGLADLLLELVQEQRERATQELADRIMKGQW